MLLRRAPSPVNLGRRRRVSSGRGAQGLVAVVIALVVLALRVPAVAAPEPAAGILGPPRKALVTALESLATWCDGNRLPGERDRTFVRILTLDRDHARARRGLRYTRKDKTAPWVRATDYVTPPDWSKGLLPEARKRRCDAAAVFRAAAGAAFDAAGAAADDGRRDEVAEISLDVAPDDIEYRKQRGDEEMDGRWVLPETAEGHRRRREFAKILASVGTPAAQIEEKTFRMGWEGAARSAHYVTIGMVPMQGCMAEVRLRELTRTFLGATLGPVIDATSRHQLVIFRDGTTARRWLASIPEYSSVLQVAELTSGVSLPDGSYATWGDEEGRTLAGVRNLISLHLGEMAADSSLRAWAMEGLGQRLCRTVAGVHAAPFGLVMGTDRPMEDGEEASGRLDRDAAWLPLAAESLQVDPARKLRAILTMKLNAMRRDDVLVAYALGAYLLEGRPESLRALVKASAASNDAEQVCRDVLGVDAATLAWRVRRWAMETGAE